jgi:mannose-6-phosphate isomerase-like protein (cupin superfamily)
MRYARDSAAAASERPAGETVAITPLFDPAGGCEPFSQRLLSFAAGRAAPRSTGADDEVLFVLGGAASLELEGARLALRERSGVYLAAGSVWTLSCSAPVELLSVLVHDPAPAGAPHALAELGAESRHDATGARQFALGVRPELGCASVTQFIGFVPPGRAPDHYHHYDEVLWVLAGSGVVHIGGEQAPLAPGVCVHLPARIVHCLENSGSSELELLGVFRPAGSPAEAYYPDGTPAPYPKES